MSRFLLVAGALAAATGLGYGAFRVVAMEMEELDFASPWQRLTPTPGPAGREAEPHRELGRARLERGEEVIFELCALDQLDPAVWVGAVDIAIWHPQSQEMILRLPLDHDLLSRARRSSEGACITLAHAAALEAGGEFAVEAVWPGRALPETVARAPVRLRILAQRPLRPLDRWTVVLLMVAAVLIAVGVTRWRPPAVGGDADGQDHVPDEPAPLVALRVGAGVGGLLLLFVLSGWIPLGGAAGGFARGLVLAVVQVGIAVALIKSVAPSTGRRHALAMVRPPRALWLLWLAPAVGLVLWLVGRLLLRMVPATGEAPIEALVSWPSGQLAVSLVGVVVPIAEELFFRGFVYGTAERRFGPALAFVLTVVLFAAAHLPQVWGAWGGLSAILVTGVGLTALRSLTRSTVAPVTAHVAHNFAIAVVATIL